jgi:hypothetical protein
MAQFSVYNPVLSKAQKPESSKFQIESTIPISFPVAKYKNADPDKEVIPVPGFTPTIAREVEKPAIKEEKKVSKPELESARQTLTSRSENKSSNKVV